MIFDQCNSRHMAGSIELIEIGDLGFRNESPADDRAVGYSATQVRDAQIKAHELVGALRDSRTWRRLIPCKWMSRCTQVVRLAPPTSLRHSNNQHNAEIFLVGGRGNQRITMSSDLIRDR